MSRSFYIAVKEPHPVHGYWVPVSEYEATPKTESYQFIPDSMNPIVSMADGKVYESKSEYRRSLKAQGYEEAGGLSKEYWHKHYENKKKIDSSRDIKEAALRAWGEIERRR